MLQVIEGPQIAAGESLSEGVDVSAGQLVRITMPEDWTDAPLTFQFSTDGNFYNDMFGLDGFEVTIKEVVPGSGVILPADIGRAIGFIRFRSGTRGDPVNQENGRLFAMAIVVPEAPEVAPEPPARVAKKKKAPTKTKKTAKKKPRR